MTERPWEQRGRIWLQFDEHGNPDEIFAPSPEEERDRARVHFECMDDDHWWCLIHDEEFDVDLHVNFFAVDGQLKVTAKWSGDPDPDTLNALVQAIELDKVERAFNDVHEEKKPHSWRRFFWSR